MNPDQAQVHSVKTTRPQFARAESLQSSAADNEFFSDYPSDASSTTTNETKTSYETPPSRASTPAAIRQPPDNSEMIMPQRHAGDRLAPLNTRDVVGKGKSRVPASIDEMSTPTPGVDDTPYIRFAIEQLTADEDVMGHGRHGSVLSDEFLPKATAPWPHSGEYLPQTPQPVQQQRQRPNEEERRQQPQYHQPASVQHHQGQLTTERQQEQRQPRRDPAHLQQQSQSVQVSSSPQKPFSKRPVVEERLIAVTAPEGQRWAELGFVPTPITLIVLLIYIFLCLLMIAGIIFSNVFTLRNNGLYDYDGNASARYFIFQYLPQLLGIVLIVWLFCIEAAIYRAMPYFCLSSDHSNQRILQDFSTIPANFVFPDFSWFRNGEPILGVVFIIFWLMNFTVPLLSCLYQTQWITNDGPARWRWATVQGVGWTLFVLYLLLVSAIAYCIIRFRSRNSALMWDPVSIADLVVLFQRSNLYQDFERTEVAQNLGLNLPEKSLRLGYWKASGRPEIFHTIGEENAAIKRLSIDVLPHFHEKGGDSQESSFDMERQRYSYASSFTRNIHSPFVRYRWTPWFLRDSAVLAWIIAAILLLIAFLVVSFVNQAVARGFLPLLSSRTIGGAFSASNFLYSFLPSLLGMVLFLAWQPIDTIYRAVQPYANLSNPVGATAERSLLVSYLSCYPVEVTLQALSNGDIKIAYISFISLMSLTIPVLAGGVFTAQQFSNDNQVRMVASMPGYIALCVFIFIYALSYCVIWPTRKRYLPHSINTIADQMSFLYASPLLTDGALRNIRTKADLVARLVGVPAGLTGDDSRREKRPSARYAFGIYIGRDGKEHLGVDRLQRPGSGEMLVTTGMKR